MLRISNRQIRRALLGLNGLTPPLPGDPLPANEGTRGAAWAAATCRRLGFVQVDPIAAVARAQHQILFTRNRRFKADHLKWCLERDRTLFENWTHDAAIIPVESYPYFRHYFERARRFEAHPGYRRYFASVTPKQIARIRRRVREDGPLLPRDVKSGRVDFKDDYFASPSLARLTMEYLWRTGVFAVTRREGNAKVYDLARRVIPAEHFERRVSRPAYVDWACRQALHRLGAATPSQIARFFDAVSTREAAAWCERRRKELVEVRVENAAGSLGSRHLCLASMVDTLQQAPPVRGTLRILSPFDPLIHDRKRTLKWFGFDYSVEIWVPAKKRRYGYYVLPLLEGEGFSGRVDAKVDRKRGQLTVLGLWWEPGVRPTRSRTTALDRELSRLAGFAGASSVVRP